MTDTLKQQFEAILQKLGVDLDDMKKYNPIFREIFLEAMHEAYLLRGAENENNKLISTGDVIEKYFKDERCIYPLISDAHKNVAGDFWLSYNKSDGIELWAHDENGEVIILKTRHGHELETVLSIYF